MSYLGTVREGKVQLPPGVTLPDGTLVRIEPIQDGQDPAYGLAEEAVSTGTPDLSEQHDHYAHGTPKRGG
jgi:hypothetical protein